MIALSHRERSLFPVPDPGNVDECTFALCGRFLPVDSRKKLMVARSLSSERFVPVGCWGEVDDRTFAPCERFFLVGEPGESLWSYVHFIREVYFHVES